MSCPHCQVTSTGSTSKQQYHPVYTMGSGSPRSFTNTNPTKSPMQTGPARTYNAFAGIDAHVYLIKTGVIFDKANQALRDDHTIILETQGVSYDEVFIAKGKAERRVEGKIICTVFDRDPIDQSYYKGYDLLLHFMNEYGHQMKIRISDMQITSRHSGASIDDLMMDMTYVFTGSAVHFG